MQNTTKAKGSSVELEDWHGLREDRSSVTNRIVEHLVFGRAAEDIADALVSSATDVPADIAIRKAQRYADIMEAVRQDMLSQEDWDLVDTLVMKLRSEGNLDPQEIL